MLKRGWAFKKIDITPKALADLENLKEYLDKEFGITMRSDESRDYLTVLKRQNSLVPYSAEA